MRLLTAAVTMAWLASCAAWAETKGATGKPEARSEPSAPGKGSGTRRERVVSDLSGFELSPRDKQTEVVGATRAVIGPEALAPRLGKARRANPLFVWRNRGEADGFIFVLVDDAMHEVHRAKVPDTRYRYPDTAEPLLPGHRYSWTVRAYTGAYVGSPSAPAGLLVLSEREGAEIDRALEEAAGGGDPFGAGLARALVFTDHRVWYDTVAAYSDLVERYPERAEAFEGRGRVYAQIPVTEELAQQDLDRADELAGQRDAPPDR